MRTARHILSTLLVFGLLASGLPLTLPEDANHDKQVDLEDAILCIRDLVRTAETPGSFSFEAETAISVLNHVAGLKRSIGPASDTKSKPASLASSVLYLVPSTNTAYYAEVSFPLSEDCLRYESFSQEPPTPPPERVCSFFMARSV
jgi:hypothetical protein